MKKLNLKNVDVYCAVVFTTTMRMGKIGRNIVEKVILKYKYNFCVRREARLIVLVSYFKRYFRKYFIRINSAFKCEMIFRDRII